MTQNSYPEPTLGPLSVGNVVNASLRLYRDHFKSYLGLALQACLWAILAYFSIIVLILLDVVLFSVSPGLGVLFLLIAIVGGMYIILYCVEKSLRNSALIARLVFQLLNNQLETIPQARADLPSNRFIFFTTQFVTGFFVGLANFSTSFIQIFFLALLSLLRIKNEFVNGLVYLIANLVGLGIYLWVFSRLFIPELAVAIEKKGPINSISRSWKLTQGFSGKIILIISIAFLITIPLYGIPLIPIIMGIFVFAGALTNNNDVSVGGILLILLGILLFISLSVFFIPFWQALKGVVYYDLRSRREGLGISFRSVDDSSNSPELPPEDQKFKL